jgi:tetratricopeptide (TPR) repeat protein/transcriptional regulator with XRE-family HTH domain
MSEVETHPSAADGPGGIGKAASGHRGRRRGVEIKPGTVKQARSEAGLSLAQVAGSEISRTAIYFVETGKAKPSIETLKLIAERTGRPLDYFLSRPSTTEARSTASTAELERLVVTGDPHGALAEGEALLSAERDPEIVARIKFQMATAHLRLAQWVPARRLASTARAHFEQSGDMLMTAECLGSEASAAYMMQDPGALALAEGALATCRALNPVPGLTESRLLGVLGGVHIANHRWAAAIKAYEQSLAAGDVIHDLRRLSIWYANLGMAYQELGNINQATHYVQRAITLHETLNDRISLGRTENNLGILLLREGEVARSRGHFERALRLFDETHANDRDKGALLLSICELELAEADVDDAARFANEALEIATRESAFTTMADAHAWLGRVGDARGDDAAADAEFAAAFEVLREPGVSPALMSRTYARYADILEARGDVVGAVQQLKLALASRSDHMAIESIYATA